MTGTVPPRDVRKQGRPTPMTIPRPAGIDLYWLPLGAGGHSVRLNGRIFETVAARLDRRDRCDLYHSALEVRVPEGRFVIEKAPVRPSDDAERGVVAEGAVGARSGRPVPALPLRGPTLARRRHTRHRRGGREPAPPQRRSRLRPAAARAGAASADAVWGRDELGAGEMWNSNSTDLVADRPQRPRRRVDPAPARRTSPRLAGRHRNRARGRRAQRDETRLAAFWSA